MILVTGGAGFVGSHLVDALLAAGHRVRVLDSLDPQVHGTGGSPPEHLSRRAEFLRADIRDREALSRALDGVDVVFHQAAAVGVAQSMYQMEHYVSVNSLGAAALLSEVAIRRGSIRRLVVASSMSLYGEGAYVDRDGERVCAGLRREEDLAAGRYEHLGPSGEELRPAPTPEEQPLHPTSIYAITKRDHEEMFLAVGAAYGIPTVALRYFNVYGTRQALSNPYTGVMAIFSARLLNGRRPIVYEDGLQSRDFVHVSDVVQANLLAMEREEAAGRVYNVGTGRPTTVLRVAETLGAELGLAEPPEVTGRYRAGDIRHCYADISRIRRELGYEPRMKLEDGMQELLRWLRGRSAEDGVERAARELASQGLVR